MDGTRAFYYSASALRQCAFALCWYRRVCSGEALLVSQSIDEHHLFSNPPSATLLVSSISSPPLAINKKIHSDCPGLILSTILPESREHEHGSQRTWALLLTPRCELQKQQPRTHRFSYTFNSVGEKS